MANNASAIDTAHKTPPRNSALSAEAVLKSTPHAVGFAVVSEHIITHIKLRHLRRANVRSWITRDVQNFEKCGGDTMLQELLARCTGSSQSLSASEKSTLLETYLKAVLPICNEGAVAQEIKGHLTDFRHCGLRELSEVVKGNQSERKPDVVVVSCQTAKAHQTQESMVLTETACKSPKDNFQWTDVRSTLELKCTRKLLTHPPAAYKTDYVVPAPSVQYMEYRKDTNGPAKPTGPTPAARPAQNPPRSVK
ncbi:hypothetical protein BDR03DRAFT_987217 [Suillus americanus]|nr:hypothetical protein BDR03DRAFT_987217 [Suillus americanus]